ncbi:efflux RND transporter periplasmic adaptor subunit [Nitrospira moscoviensis]|uniref:Putative Efflux transporter, RND family, MFP subunit, Macrolide-specific efflux protein n=1 Tax=Nitrospira moscoviensis TaxID=42253 RepID=A0A0K2G941_NITMO|nr:efflux RND transporter periplasmic adaptor subunit [Nitrospira moscoviensis]ALA57389.1 putative Efflux transporter, RND family, MFP subunit, Macrolide-specific efflux protein [Nitrospira moscoviensis]
MRRLGLILAVAAIGLAIGGYVFFNGERKAPIRYRTAPVDRGSVVSIVSATGTINPVVSVQVGTQVSGMIKSLHADFNSRVKAGDTVAVIDPEPFRARRDQAASNLEMARSNVARAKVDLAQRKRELDRVQSLIAQQFVSQNDVDVALTNQQSAEAQLRVAEAQVKQAEAALNSAELDLKYTVIRSPVDGIVVARNVEVGQTVAASFATPNLFLIALDLTKMQVDTNVSESDIGGISEGKEAAFTVDAYPGVRFAGTIRQVRLAPINVQNVVTYNVVVAVDNQDLRLKPGMTANVSIIVAQRDQALRVPSAALRFTPPAGEGKAVKADGQQAGRPAEAHANGHRKTIWKVGQGGDLEPILVQTGISDGVSTEVVAGPIAEGDQVVVGIETPRGERRAGDLPPGFGSGQRRGRDRGL